MKKIENKFLYFILILIVFIIWFSVYISLFKKSVDRNSYVELINWEWYINDIFLVKNDKNKLNINDLIKTVWDNSMAIIEWWDWSVTRLWWNSSLKVNELYVSNNKDKLNISFELFKWKSWSNVISYIWEDSYFKQSFMDREAAVRWTTFNVDIDNDYLYVVDHKVDYKDSSWEVITIEEKKPLKISTFSFIQLDEFIRNIRDSAFDELNRRFDREYIDKLKKELESKINNLISISSSEIDKLSLKEKELYYSEIISYYQDINFIKSSDDKELFDLKLKLKEKLFSVSTLWNQKLLMESFVFDLKDSINTKSYDSLNNILIFINSNSTLLDVKEDLFLYINKINLWDNIKDSFISNINTFKSTINSNFNLDKDNILNKFNEVDSAIRDTLETEINNFIK